MLHFFKKLKLCKILVARQYIKCSHQNLFTIVCIIYHFHNLFGIINKRIFYNWKIILNNCFICKVNIRGNLCWLMPLTDIFGLSEILLYFSLWWQHFFVAASCIFKLKCFNCNSTAAFPFIQLVPYIVIKFGCSLTCGNHEAMYTTK